MTEDIDRISDAYHCQSGESARRIATEGVAITALLLAKNADYGGSAWQVPTLAPGLDPGTAILVRMSDKIARLSTLLAANAEAQVTESIEDTLRDLAGYAMLYLARPRECAAEGSGVEVQGSGPRRCATCEHYGNLAPGREPCRSCVDANLWMPSQPAQAALAVDPAQGPSVAASVGAVPKRRCITCVLYEVPGCLAQADLSCWRPAAADR